MKKQVYSIPASLPFSLSLARWVMERYGDEPTELSRILLFLPSRRACIAMREAFLKVSGGKPLLLPRMQPLGDVNEDLLLSSMVALSNPPPLPEPSFAVRRLWVLAHMVRLFHSQVQGRVERMEHALLQAKEIAALLDKIEREGAVLTKLSDLVPQEFAAHWQLTADFLTLLDQHWPDIAAEKQLVNPVAIHNQMVRSLASAWKMEPPAYPVIAAGTTGSIPSTAELLDVIATLPQGAVVLPGLDRHMSNNYREAITEDHPQWAMHALLAHMNLQPEEVRELCGESPEGEARVRFLSRAFCPAQVMQEWRDPLPQVREALQNFSCVTFPTQQEEAKAIALMLRETLETEDKTAALVTHDRELARRVIVEMLRYGIKVDDSAGQPLATTPPATFLRLIADAADHGFAPAKLLAVLKHPLCTLGMERMECLELARLLEQSMMRGICPSGGFAGIKAAMASRHTVTAQLFAFVEKIEQAVQPLQVMLQGKAAVEFRDLLTAHLATARAMADAQMWREHNTETLDATMDEMFSAAHEAGEIDPQSYPQLFEALLAGRVVRPAFGTHPRLKILSPMEARLQHYDRVIIGELNEGSWPSEAMADPWFNRSMRAAIGLACPERQVGQAAHDFFMLAAVGEVIITRADKVEGSPAKPSRWWTRIMTLLGHLGAESQVRRNVYAQWAGTLDAAPVVMPCARPAPIPPLDVRPIEISVTQVETAIVNPYAFYAASILKLKKLHALDEDPTAADFGIYVHRALQRFVEQYPNTLPPQPLDKLIALAHREFDPLTQNFPSVGIWWLPRFEQLAEWVIARECELRPLISQVWPEVSGQVSLGGIRLKGRADRVELLKDGSLAIVDYKTGSPHTKTDTREGRAVQLMLLSLMAQEGQWQAGIDKRKVGRLEYWLAGGGRREAEVRPVDEEHIEEYTQHAKAMLEGWVRNYLNPSHGFPAAADSRFNDYEHLSRIQEWR